MADSADDAARYKAERDFERQRTAHHARHSRELERLIATLIAAAKHKPRCKCKTATALRDLAAELDTPHPRERR
jgi:hypothetical protein